MDVAIILRINLCGGASFPWQYFSGFSQPPPPPPVFAPAGERTYKQQTLCSAVTGKEREVIQGSGEGQQSVGLAQGRDIMTEMCILKLLQTVKLGNLEHLASGGHFEYI